MEVHFVAVGQIETCSEFSRIWFLNRIIQILQLCMSFYLCVMHIGFLICLCSVEFVFFMLLGSEDFRQSKRCTTE